jgi:NADPH:quinone reductase-like Zn-dependent oxidoreductase
MSQKALLLEKPGQPMVLAERPIPEPKENQVLVKVAIAGINPHDGYSKAWGLFVKDSLPTPLAVDIVGDVVKAGPKVTKFHVGDTVFGFGDPWTPDELGTQEYCCLDVDQTAKIPSNVSPDEAATFPLNPMTSFFAMFTGQGLDLPFPWPGKRGNIDNSGVTIAIIGGGSATGKFALQLAKLAGLGRVITIASKSNEAQLKSLGATHVIDRHQSLDEIDKDVRVIVGDDLTMVYDCIGGANGGQTLGAKLLSNSKRGILTILVHAGTVDESQIGDKREGYERKPIICRTKEFKDVSVPFWNQLPTWIENNDLSPTTWQVVDGLDAKKINDLLDGYVQGRAALKPHVHI